MKPAFTKQSWALLALFAGLALIPLIVTNRYYLHMINLAGI